MKINLARFVTSNTDYQKCPPHNKPEFAFIGRSNVGKSSLINMLANNNKLAKSSSTPGKTQLINHFLINESWYLVDLPGYGYAKVSKTNRKDWQKFIRDFILERTQLTCLFVLIDSRHEPQKIDVEFVSWLGSKSIPIAIVFTKADKSKPGAVQRNVDLFRAAMAEAWDELPDMFITSAENATGKEELLNYIGAVINSL